MYPETAEIDLTPAPEAGSQPAELRGGTATLPPSQPDPVLETLALLANAMADINEQFTRRLDAMADQVEARLTERVRTLLTDVGRQIYEKVEAEASDLRQVGHLAARRVGVSGPRIRCIFLVHAIESWDAQIDVYEAMRRDSRFDPLVASINRRFPGDAGYGGEEQTSAALREAGIPHIRLGMEPSWPALDILRALQPDVIFRQSQWEPDVPPAFATSRLSFARICSVPYGMSIVGKFSPSDSSVGGVNEQSFDQYYHRMAWRVFCETEQTRDYFVQFGHSDPEKFVVSGYPKLTRLLRARDEEEKWPIASAGDRRFRIVWAPHYSVGTDWLGFGTFDRIHRDFLALARQRPDIEFVLKPHPALFPFAVRVGVLSQQDLDDFLTAWRALPNCAIETGTYAHLFAASDMMITDGLSFFTEYPIFEKPLVFFDSARHVPLNALGDAALAAAHHVTTFAGLQAAVEAYASGAPWRLDEQRQALLKILFPRRRDPAEIILASIADGLAPHRGEAS
jgi:hypothetical protein